VISALTLTSSLTAGTTLSSIGNTVAGNLLTAGLVSATGNVTGNYFIGNGSQLTGVTATGIGTLSSLSVTGNTTTGNLLTGGVVSATGNVIGGNLNAAGLSLSSNVVSVLNSTSAITTTANITGGNLTTAGVLTVNSGAAATAIVNGAGNAVGNIGSTSSYFNRLYAQATTALYADLAENYQADADYEPGTVVIFGGDQQITVTTEVGDERVAGAVSTQPAHLMNAGQPGIPLALRGQVPVKVTGPVVKGDSLVTSSQPGYAESVGRDRSYAQAVFAKSLETNLESGNKIIIAVIL